MVLYLTDKSGNFLTQSKVQDMTIKCGTKSAVIRIHGADKDIVQKLGKANRVITLEGFVTGSTGVQFLNNAVNYTGSIYYHSSALNMDLLGASNQYVVVFFSSLTWSDKGGKPMERDFVLELVEIVS